MALVRCSFPAIAAVALALLTSPPLFAQGLPRLPEGGAARSGVVVVVREGKPLGIGSILAADGRILTSLSALGALSIVDIQYPDGHAARARVAHKDASIDLALLVPLSGRVTDGIRASERDPKRQPLNVLTLGSRKSVESFGVMIRADAIAQLPNGERLSGAFDLYVVPSAPTGWVEGDASTPAPPPAPLLGAPVVDSAGDVVAMIVRLCRIDAPGHCSPAPVALGVRAIRSFLQTTPTTAALPLPWLGLQGEAEGGAVTRGVRVLAVAPGGPAQKAGVRASADRKKGHLVMALDGASVDSPEKLAQEVGKHGAGDTVRLTVLDGDRIRDISVVLGTVPEPSK